MEAQCYCYLLCVIYFKALDQSLITRVLSLPFAGLVYRNITDTVKMQKKCAVNLWVSFVSVINVEHRKTIELTKLKQRKWKIRLHRRCVKVRRIYSPFMREKKKQSLIKWKGQDLKFRLFRISKWFLGTGCKSEIYTFKFQQIWVLGWPSFFYEFCKIHGKMFHWLGGKWCATKK